MNAVERQNYYIARQGGTLNLIESDNTLNDLSRAIIREVYKKYPKAMLVDVNPKRGNRVFTAVSECEILYNFCGVCVVPEYDEKLELLILRWRNTAHISVLDLITERVDEIGGKILTWT